MDNDEREGFACINGELVDKDCSEMSDEELAAFMGQGAWRRNSIRPDGMAEAEATLRGTKILKR